MSKEAVLINKNTSGKGSGGTTEEQLEINKGVDNKDYQLGKNTLHRISTSESTDVVYGRYKIIPTKPIENLSTKLAKAYQVTDLKTNDSNSFYCVILDNGLPSRLTLINKLLDNNINNFVNIKAAQIVKSSINNARVYAIILQKPEGITINDFLKTNGPINEDAVITRIIRPIANVVLTLEKLDITHGKINLDNVYISNTGEITLGECISEPCGYSQPLIYESCARASCIDIGKGPGIPGLVDYHSLAVMSVLCVRGRNPYENIADKLIINLKYEKNTYRMVTDGIDISPYMSDFLRGAINENIRQTWNRERMTEWLGGRRCNLLPPTDNIDAGRPLMYNNKRFLNMRYLAYALYQDWDNAKKFIKESTLVRWIERSVQDSKLAEKMEILSNRTSNDDPESSFDRNDELLAQYIMLLDPSGPIRIKQASVNIGGVGTLLSQAINDNENELIEAVNIIIRHSLASYKDFDKNNINFNIYDQDDTLLLQRCTELIRKPHIGFGIERMLYELNPEVPCRSPLVKDSYVCAVPDMFEVLKDTKLNNEIFDIHIKSFLSAKLELPVKLRIKSLGKFPSYASHDGIGNLALLSVAQQTFNVRDIPELTMNIYEMIYELIESFHNRVVRQELIDEIKKYMNNGNLTDILSVLTDRKFLINDRVGFRRAVIKYRNNTIQITKLNNKKAVNNMGYLYGLQLSVILTFFLATIVVMVLILKIF